MKESEEKYWEQKVNGLSKDDRDKLRANLATGFYFRRERYWKVFTWASGVFTALIVGLILRGDAAAIGNPFFLVILFFTATLLLFVSVRKIKHDKVQVKFRADLIKIIDKDRSYWIGDLEERSSRPASFDKITSYLPCFSGTSRRTRLLRDCK